jgi:hypothetical protein
MKLATMIRRKIMPIKLANMARPLRSMAKRGTRNLTLLESELKESFDCYEPGASVRSPPGFV